MRKVLTKAGLNKIRAFAYKKYKRNDFIHQSDHLELTAKLAILLAKEENADKEVCIVAAYLHDIARGVNRGKHGTKGARMARHFLKKIGLPYGFIGKVCYAISQHDQGSSKRTIEAKILWDADKLQSVGPLGFLRIFAYHLLYETTDIYLASRLTSRLQNFFYKRFQTKSGRILAKKLHLFMREFNSLLSLAGNVKIKKAADDYCRFER